MKYISSTCASLAILLLPMFSLAQSGPQKGFGGIGKIVEVTLNFINFYLIPAVFAIAFIVFIWGIFKYFIMGGANEGDQEKGKQLAMWGILGFVIIVSVWGLVNVIADGLGFSGSNAPPLPKIQGIGGSASAGSGNTGATTNLTPGGMGY
ncbi:pilin [Patescibacteria group bacterium]|nr:pilin [Patescibacteria group bacterium]